MLVSWLEGHAKFDIRIDALNLPRAARASFTSRSRIASSRAPSSPMGHSVSNAACAELPTCRKVSRALVFLASATAYLAAAPDVSLKSCGTRMWVKEIMSSSARKQGKRRADECRTERFKKKAEV